MGTRTTLKLRSDGLTWQQIDGSFVILDLTGSEYFRVQGTAATLWESLAAGCTTDDLADRLVATYDVALETARADVADFVAQLETANLLESGA